MEITSEQFEQLAKKFLNSEREGPIFRKNCEEVGIRFEMTTEEKKVALRKYYEKKRAFDCMRYSWLKGQAFPFLEKTVKDGTPGDFMKLVRMSYDNQINGLLNAGVGFVHPDDEIILNGRQRRKNKRNLSRLHKDEEKFTIGDAIKLKKPSD